MLAFCVDGWDDIARVGTRIGFIIVCSWGVWLCGRKALGIGHESMVPRKLWALPAAALLWLVLQVIWLTLTCTLELSPWERTLYGAAILWSLVGTLLVIQTGDSKVEEANRRADEYRVKLTDALADLAEGHPVRIPPADDRTGADE